METHGRVASSGFHQPAATVKLPGNAEALANMVTNVARARLAGPTPTNASSAGVAGKAPVSIPYRPGQEGQRVHRADRGRKRRGPRGHSQFRGVCITKTGKWRAVIYVERKQHYLGVYETELQAAKAYDRAAKRHFGATAKLNFPEDSEDINAKAPITGTPHQPLVLPSSLHMQRKALQNSGVSVATEQLQQAALDSLTREAYVQEQRLSAFRAMQAQQMAAHARVRGHVSPIQQTLVDPIVGLPGPPAHLYAPAGMLSDSKAELYRVVDKAGGLDHLDATALFKCSSPQTIYADAAYLTTAPESLRLASNISPGRSTLRVPEQQLAALGGPGLLQYAPVGIRSADGVHQGLVPVSHVTLMGHPKREAYTLADVGSHEAPSQPGKRRLSTDPYPNGLNYAVLKRARHQYEMEVVSQIDC